MMELIDTHCHLTFEQLTEDLEAVVERSETAGVTGWVTVGTDAEHNKKAIKLANKFDNMYAAVGIHPHYAKDVTGKSIAELKELADNEKVVAIGEAGLDFHYDFCDAREQERLFAQQLKIARELNLPVIVHSREAFEETMAVLEQFGGGVKKVVFHCFGGSAEQAKIILEYGFYISFTGVVTFKNAESIREAAKVVPPERLMVETDCPYMSPEPLRNQKTNEPSLMIHTVKALAELKGVDLDDFAKSITATSKEFFGLP